MPWEDKDDEDLQTSLDRLVAKQTELESQLRPIGITINNTRRIQSKKITSFNDKKERIEVKTPPKDKWGDDMTDEYRLKIKDECIAKVNELLGIKVIDEE